MIAALGLLGIAAGALWLLTTCRSLCLASRAQLLREQAMR